MTITERLWSSATTNTGLDHLGHVAPHLLGGRGDAGHSLSGVVDDSRRIADDEDLWKARNAQIRSHLDAPCPVPLHVEPFSGWGCHHARSPDDCIRVNTFSFEVDPILIAVCHPGGR